MTGYDCLILGFGCGIFCLGEFGFYFRCLFCITVVLIWGWLGNAFAYLVDFDGLTGVILYVV